MPSRRRLLQTAGVGALASLTGCASLPAGPTEGITYSRTRQMDVPTVSPPAAPTDAHVLARRAHLDGLVTAAEPLYERVSREEIDERYETKVVAGVPSVRDFLDESADDPASMDAGFAKSRVRYAAFALGFLRSWHDLATPESALDRIVDAHRALEDATASMPRDCADPARYLARVGWAERMLFFAYIGIDQYGSDPASFELDPPDARERVDAYVGTLYRQAAKARGFVLDARYLARAYREERPDDTAPFGFALARNRRRLLERAREREPEREAHRTKAGQYDDEALAAYVRRAGNPAGNGREQQRYGTFHGDAGRLAFGAVAAGRANCHYAGYERVLNDFDPETIRDGVDAGSLFAEKRAVVRAVRDALGSDDPLLSWLASEPARLLYAGEVYLDHETVDSETIGRAVCLSFFRHARGYADEMVDVAETLERRA